MSTHKIICGDSLELLPTLPQAKMIFADPPDNIGMEYTNYVDSIDCEDYLIWLSKLTLAMNYANPGSYWLSYNQKWDLPLLGNIWSQGLLRGYILRKFIWRFTFGQHRTKDCGNGYRPILRFSQQHCPTQTWNTSDIRVESRRQQLGDKRANPEGRVPDDVWEFPRIVGNAKERRTWISNQHPEKLLERMIRMSTNPGDLVIDMFAGSGTTHRVCKRLGRNSISIDISPEYCDRIRKD